MARIIYKNKDGKRVSSVTTILSVLDKPALKYWANKLGLEGINVKDYVDDKATIGTTAHYIIECFLTDKTPDFSTIENVTDEQIETARKCASKFFDWLYQQKNFIPIANELYLVSEKYQYGGTTDCIAILNDKLTLIDFKTCNAIYDEPYKQVSAYAQNTNENFEVIEPILRAKGFNQTKIEQLAILRIGRDETEGFEYIEIPEELQEISFKNFLDVLKVYNSNKEFTKIKKQVYANES